MNCEEDVQQTNASESFTMNSERSFVAIVGGFGQLATDAARASAQELSRVLGAALAEAEMGIIVYNSDGAFLEPHVVNGYVQTAKTQGEALIRVRYVATQRPSVRFQEQETHKSLFDVRELPGDNWAAPFYRSLVELEGIDAVMLLGGGRSTFNAGQIALGRRMPILALDNADGAAKEVREQLAAREPNYPVVTDTKSVADAVSWLKNECAKFRSERNEIEQNRIDIARIKNAVSSGKVQSKRAVSAAIAFVALFVGVVTATQDGLRGAAYVAVTILCLTAAGATGSLVRATIWPGGDATMTTSGIVGGIAGFVAGVAYEIPQWIGAPNMFSRQGPDDPYYKIQLISAVLVAMTAGVSFDSIFLRLRDNARDISLDPVKGKGKP